ncbi:hypothetical protein NPIL_225501 [Nephila pilipes]|uniref:Uncharacterized protein n=1 Tax=Nephila pilipes TaxID=299642 RepID=A0A8X6QVU8_NEPPI|nr:hypothetical protein NPIL_225501 [Nephila pilipes]
MIAKLRVELLKKNEYFGFPGEERGTIWEDPIVQCQSLLVKEFKGKKTTEKLNCKGACACHFNCIRIVVLVPKVVDKNAAPSEKTYSSPDSSKRNLVRNMEVYYKLNRNEPQFPGVVRYIKSIELLSDIAKSYMIRAH